ncbi:MAG: prolipoprotein diacylglyceryl transferase [Parcubacteria group bacterium]|nr:prolipoprotein diacylglyceryl transferase [Parcubacteria group bacterium]
MIPYFQYNSIILGPLTLQIWGIFVSLGLVAGILLSYKLAKKYCLSQAVILDLAIWALVGGLIIARIFHVVFYEPVYYLQYPIDVLKFWQGGASSLGGFLGAAGAIWLFAKKRKFKLKEFLPYLDIAAISLWLGWGIGRLGCFLIHDHKGVLSDFFLAVNFPNGARHDLGLHDSLLAFALFASYYLLFAKLIKWHWGLVTIFSFIDYAIVRFFLDFLRADSSIIGGDIRYWYLTPAQWGMVGVIVGLIFILAWCKFKRKISINQQNLKL